MQTYLKSKPVWVQLLLFLGMAFGLFLIVSLVGATLLSKATGISVLQLQDVNEWDPKNPNMIIFIRGLLVMQFISLFLLPSLLFGYFSDPQPMRYLGLKAPDKWMYWLLAILALMVSIPFVDYMGFLNQKMVFGGAQKWVKSMEDEASKQIQFMLSKHTPKELIVNLVFIALFAGIGEELFFRGVLQRLMIKLTKNPWTGIIITAALFSGFHFQFFGFIPRFLLGILLGAVYWYSGSLFTAMLAHFAYDGLMIVLIYFNPSMAESTDATLLHQTNLQLLFSATLSLLLTLLIIWQMKKRSSASFVEVYKGDNETPDEFTFE
jgi:uncharacterized protein